MKTKKIQLQRHVYFHYKRIQKKVIIFILKKAIFWDKGFASFNRTMFASYFIDSVSKSLSDERYNALK